MNQLVLLVVGFALGVIITFLLLSWVGSKVAAVPPRQQTREQVAARVLLHQTRRNRQLAELERQLGDGFTNRLRQLGQSEPGGDL